MRYSIAAAALVVLLTRGAYGTNVGKSPGSAARLPIAGPTAAHVIGPAAAGGTPSAKPAPQGVPPGAEPALREAQAEPAEVQDAPGERATSVDLGAILGAPGSQGENRNTCSVFAAAGLAEYLLRVRRGEDFKVSESYLYYSAKRDFTDAPDLRAYKDIDGLAGFVAVQALQGPLLPADAWPYDPVPPSTRAANASGIERFTGSPPAGYQSRLRTDLRFQPVSIDRREIKHFLVRDRTPVVFNILWYAGAADHATGRLRNPTDEERRTCRESGLDCSGHVILITGYDTATKEYIFRNSLGPNWGQDGYGRLSEDYIENDCETCGHLENIDSLRAEDRRMVLDGSRGWSARLLDGPSIPAKPERADTGERPRSVMVAPNVWDGAAP